VICDLQYDYLLPEKQEDIRRYLMKAALYQDSTDDRWQGGWLELSVNQDVPAEWFVDVLVPDINREGVSFNSELDYYRRPDLLGIGRSRIGCPSVWFSDISPS